MTRALYRQQKEGTVTRRKLDAYETDEQLARFLIELLPILPAENVLEPSAGEGVFVRAVRASVPDAYVVAIEPRSECRQALRESGTDIIRVSTLEKVTDALWAAWGVFDWVVGNPPYSHAEAHVRAIMGRLARGGRLAFLLRLNFLGAAKRNAFWQDHPPKHIWVLSERPSFTGGGTDMTEYAFFLWEKGYEGPTTLSVVSWKEER
jgi:hypothetical protein